jgi:hypothetical protein
MDSRIIRRRRYGLTALLLLAAALTGCAPLASVEEETATATPLPESPAEDGLTVQPPDACLVAEDAVIQLLQPQGNLLAWQPGEDSLAFVAPVGRSWGWSVGDAVVAPLEEGEPFSTNDLRVAGDLTWSPDGVWLAFSVLRPSDDRYTVYAWRPADKTLIDLFGEGGGSDPTASPKGIVEWLDGNRLLVSEGCGTDCRSLVEVSVLGSELRIREQIREDEDHSLAVDLNQPEGFTLFEGWLNPNVSPDELSVFFSDEDDIAWIGYVEEGIKYPLDLRNGTPLESKWSDDSRYLAVRTEQQVLVYELGCREGREARRLGE